jgi:hypothetical protein
MYKVIAGSWTQFEKDAKYIREQVFIQEQGIDPKMNGMILMPLLCTLWCMTKGSLSLQHVCCRSIA